MRKRWIASILSLVLGLSLITSAAPANANTLLDTNFACDVSYDTDWWCSPVLHIRVKRMSKTNQPVETFTFDYWLKNTLPNEIHCNSPNYSTAVVEATAIALRMYGWARHLRYGHNSPTNDFPLRAYDVTDNGQDGAWFIPGSETSECNAVLANTAGIMLVRGYSGSGHGTIFETEWRQGDYAPVTSAMLNSDRLQQMNAQYEIYHGRWTTREDILSYFYDSYHIQYY